MITYIIKSTISLVVLYGFYHFFLRQYKILIFNRIYLISSLAFSLVIPFIIIPVKAGFTINSSINALTVTTNQIIQKGGNTVSLTPHITVESIFGTLFLVISVALLLRFVLNITNLIIKIRKSKRIENQLTTIVLVEENIIPYSFFRYIFVNSKSYEEGKIEKEILLHEEAHCLHYHSIDILILEIINVFFWFNPVIWLFRKAIQLNHEYYADNSVLSNSDSADYQQFLINLVIQNNTSYLASNFKYSQIKNRLEMMINNKPLHLLNLRKFSAVILFLVVGIFVSFGQKTIDPKKSNVENPHKFQQESNIENTQNFQLEGASEVTIVNNIWTCSGNVIIRIPKTETNYTLIKTDSATYDKEKNMITVNTGTLEIYNSGDIDPIEIITFVDLKYDAKTGKTIINKINAVVNFKDKK